MKRQLRESQHLFRRHELENDTSDSFDATISEFILIRQLRQAMVVELGIHPTLQSSVKSTCQLVPLSAFDISSNPDVLTNIPLSFNSHARPLSIRLVILNAPPHVQPVPVSIMPRPLHLPKSPCARIIEIPLNNRIRASMTNTPSPILPSLKPGSIPRLHLHPVL